MKQTFTKYNETFRLVSSAGKNAIYSRAVGREAPTFEVVIFYQDKHGELHYPGSSTWGIRGWSYDTIEAANERFEKLTPAPLNDTVQV